MHESARQSSRRCLHTNRDDCRSACARGFGWCRSKQTAPLSVCGQNLKQVSFAHLFWVNDHERGVLPGQISTNDGGTMEYLQNGKMFRHFQSLSNELFDPALPPPADLKLLVCPSDNRRPAKDFSTLSNSNLSYFVNGGVGRFSGSGPWNDPPRDSIGYVVFGDRNVTNSGGRGRDFIVVDRTQQVGWKASMHNRSGAKVSIGNIAEADGTVRKLTAARLQLKNYVTEASCCLGWQWPTSAPPSFPLYLP